MVALHGAVERLLGSSMVCELNSMCPAHSRRETRLKPFQEDQDRAMGPILLQHLGATEEAMVEDPVVLEVINKHFVQLKPFDKYFDMLLKT